MEAKGTALVTGAGRGLGRGIALELAGRGFDVVAGVRDEAVGEELRRAAEGLAGSLRPQLLDLCVLGDYRLLADLKVLVNNAGYRGRYLPIEEADMAEWRRSFETNVFGVLDLTRRAIPAMRQGGGVICNVGTCGIFAPMPFYSSYRASKAALSALSQGLRVELAPFGIRVIEIPIGGVDTDMMRDSIAVRPPEAIAFEPYRPMAERVQAMAQSGAANAVSPAEAAHNIAEAILAEGGPLWHPCDTNARAILGHVATSTEETRLYAMLERFGFAG